MLLTSKVLSFAYILLKVIQTEATKNIILQEVIITVHLPNIIKLIFPIKDPCIIITKSESKLKNKVVQTILQWRVKLTPKCSRRSFHETCYKTWRQLKRWAYFQSYETCISMRRIRSVGERRRGWEISNVECSIKVLDTQILHILVIIQKYLILRSIIIKKIPWLHSSQDILSD